MPARALVILAEGAEEMEVVVTVDVLRRAGVEVVLAGLDGPGPVTCSRGVKLVADVSLKHAKGAFDVVILPGGTAGAERLAASATVGELLQAQVAAGRLVAAICAAPIVLVRHGVLLGDTLTCHPSVADEVRGHARVVQDVAVVEAGQLITSPGPGAALHFALALVRRLCGEATAAQVQAPLQWYPPL